MTEENDLKITLLTVRLQNSTTLNYNGTGIIYFQDNFNDKVYILTASHCLFEDVDGFENLLENININVYNSSTKKYDVINHIINPNLLFRGETKDVAVLVVNKAIIEQSISSIPAIKVVQEKSIYRGFFVKGFPKATFGEELAVLYPTWLQHIDIDNRFQLQLNEDYTEYNTQGFSGSGAFLIAESELYLYGIFTRFRPEDKGRVIYLQYLETVNELLDKNYLPRISFNYFGNFGLTPDFFSQHITTAIENLGPRFNKDLNFQLPIAKVFNDIAMDNLFFKRFLNLVDNWILEKGYRQRSNNIHLDKIESDNSLIKQKVTDWIQKLEHSVTKKIEIDWILDSLTVNNTQIDAKRTKLYKLQRKEEEKNKDVKREYNYRPPYETEIERLREISSSNEDFIENISNKVNINLANNPFLIITGDAGNGKSHLLGDIAKTRTKKKLPTLLLLGQQFVGSKNVWENVNSSLSLAINTKEGLLDSLNNIGKQIGSRVLILVDAINEGAGADVWESQIAGFLNDFKKYPFIGVVLSIRTTYLNFVIPEQVINDPLITFKNHEGFKGNEYAALKLFCEFHDLKQPHFPILAPEFTNPLFLQLICNSIKLTPEKTFPQGFQGMSKIFEIYVNAINVKFQKKREEYRYSNIVLEAVHKVALKKYNNKNESLLLKDVKTLLKKEFAENKFLLNDLIEENIFITNPQYNHKNDKTQEALYFAYQRFGDFYVADEMLKEFDTKSAVLEAFKQENKFGKLISDRNGYWYNNGILEAFSILLPERFDLEIFEVYDWYFTSDEEKFQKGHVIHDINTFLLDSLNWRKLESIDDEKLVKWFNGNYFNISNDDYYYKLSELSTIAGHPFNSDRLTRILKSYKMPQRDSFWQQHLRLFNGFNDDETACPLRRLIDWAWTPEISPKLDFETARLTAQALTWLLACTDIKVRDETTKSLVNLLEQQPEVLIWILKKFKSIDDPYISERLYAVAYGCILRTEKKSSIEKIAITVYNLVFKNQKPPKHILIRDYARNIVEFAIYKNPNLKINIDCISPPYESNLPDRLPSDTEVLKYNFPYNNPEAKRHYKLMNNRIYHSVVGFGDFSKHIDARLNSFAPTSFTFETEYNLFYKTLLRSQKKLLRDIISVLKIKSSYNKDHYIKTRMGIEKFNERMVILDNLRDQYVGFIEETFQDEQRLFVINKVLPFLKSKYENYGWKLSKNDINSYKYWIIQRVHKLGYKYSLHGRFDELLSRNNHGYKIDRIGKKYQKIALFEILAIISDNYKLNMFSWKSDKKYEFYKGAWQIYIRDIDPAFIVKNNIEDDDEEKDDLGISNKQKDWWEDLDYKYWNQPSSIWIDKLEDLPDLKEILEKKDLQDEKWFCLKKFSSWDEPKPIGEGKYDFQRKEIFYKVQGYLVNKKDKKKIITWLSQQNFWGEWMPESREYNNLLNREKFWSPAYFDSDKENKWETINDTNLKVIIASTNAVNNISGDNSGAQFGYEMPCRTIFEGMDLQYAPVDGEFKNSLNQIIAVNKNFSGVLIKKKEFLDFLNIENLEIVWTVLGEKSSFHSKSETNYQKELSGVYYLENNEIKGIMNSFTRE